MDSDLRTAFGALSPAGKARVLARVIHMETIYVRDVHDRFPGDSERLYASSEFVHRLANGIIGVLNPIGSGSERWGFDVILRTYTPRGPYYLDKLSSWVTTEV